MSHIFRLVRVALDTSILVAGLRSQLGASNRILMAVAEGRFRPMVSTALFLEYEAVLLRAEHRLVTGMSEEDVQGFLSALASAAVPVEINFGWRPQLRDPADELVLGAAVNGMAVAIVTHNVADFEPAASRFGLRVLKPAEFLKELRES